MCFPGGTIGNSDLQLQQYSREGTILLTMKKRFMHCINDNTSSVYTVSLLCLIYFQGFVNNWRSDLLPQGQSSVVLGSCCFRLDQESPVCNTASKVWGYPMNLFAWNGLICFYLYLLYFLCLSKNSNSMQIYLAQDEDLEDVQGLLLLCVRDSCSCSCLGQAKPSSKKQYRKHWTWTGTKHWTWTGRNPSIAEQEEDSKTSPKQQ